MNKSLNGMSREKNMTPITRHGKSIGTLHHSSLIFSVQETIQLFYNKTERDST